MKTIIKIFLSFVIVISPIFLINSANAAVGGWTLGGGVAQGASTVYEGTKQVIIDGKNYIKTGTAKITPTASQVAKVLARGAAGYALSVAVEQLLGSVDWVLDPANNQIRYTKPDTSNDPCTTTSCTQYQYYWSRDTDLGKFGTQTGICQAVAAKYGQTLISVSQRVDGQWACNTRKSNGDADWWAVNRVANPTYDPTAEDPNKEKTIPLEVVAAQVISNAEGNTDKKAAAQVATMAAAADVVAEAEGDSTKAKPIVDQLNGSSSTKPADSDAAANAGTGTATATPQSDPVTGEQAPPTDIALEFPIFCDWAPTICEAAQTVISFPTTLTEWWTTAKEKSESWALSISDAWVSFRDWFKSDDDLPDDEKPQISEISTPELKEDAIRWSAQCPADAQVPINMQGVSSTITFSWSPWCQLLDMIKPAIIASAYIGAAFIVLGLRT